MLYLLEHPDPNRQRELARQLLFFGLAQEYAISGEVCICRKEGGKPFLRDYADIHFNYSHSRQGILCGIDSMEIGVDIERIIPYRERLARRICHPGELKLLESAQSKDEMMTLIWTAKESYLKYLGTGIRSDLREYDLSGCCEKHFQMQGCHFQMSLRENFGMAVCGEREYWPVRKVEIWEIT